MSDLNSWEDDPTVQEDNLSRQTQQMNLNNTTTTTSGGFRPSANSFQPSVQPFQPGQQFQQYGGYDQSQYQQYHPQGQGYGYPQYGAQGGYGQYPQGGYGGVYSQGGYNQQYGMESLYRKVTVGFVDYLQHSNTAASHSSLKHLLHNQRHLYRSRQSRNAHLMVRPAQRLPEL
jgi:hypothetical protein